MKIRSLLGTRRRLVVAAFVAAVGALTVAPGVAAAVPGHSATAHSTHSTARLTTWPDWANGAYPWALDDFTYQTYVNGTRTTYYEHGTFTATYTPTTGTALSTPVHGSFEGTLVYTSTFPSGCTGCVPYAIDFTYHAPKGWVFTESQTPGVLDYSQSMNFPLEDAIP